MSNVEKLVIKRAMNRPRKDGIDGLTALFCEVFDLSGNDSEPALLKEIAESSMSGNGVTSKKLNEKLSIPRSTVIYHLNRFIYSGIIIRKGRKYYLRSGDMTGTITELQSDLMMEFKKLLEFAEKMDEILEEEMNGR
jgi:predicted transcriptional regulator